MLRPKRGKVPKSRVEDMFKLPVSIKKNLIDIIYFKSYNLKIESPRET